MLPLLGVLAGAGGIIAATDKSSPKPITESFEQNEINLALEAHTRYLWKLTGGGVIVYLLVVRK